MASSRSDEEEKESAAQSPKLTEALTALVTRARMKTKPGPTREEPALPTGRAVSLLVTDGQLKGQSFPIQKPQIVIGRTDGDIILSDAQVSRLHCVIEVHGLTALVVDLESGNGTYVNGRKIRSREIDHMTEFRIGETTLMFVVSGR